MNYKVSGAINKSKKYFIIYAILWVFISIVLIMPITIGIHEIKVQQNISAGFEKIIELIPNIGKTISVITSEKIWGEYFKNEGLFTILYAILMTIGIIKAAPKNEYTDIEHGSSDWSKNGEQYAILNNKKGIVLAENNYLPVDKRGNVNVLVVGGSGSGKSASYSIPNACQLLGSYVFTDPKGELYDRTAGFMKAHGYKIKVLNLVKPQNSDGYNPLHHITSEIDVDVIANTIVKGQKSDGGSDPYWDDMAEMLLKALIYYLMATRPEEEQNLASCAELVRAANSNGGSNLLTELISKLPYDHPARMNYKSIEIAPEKTYGSILSTLQSKLGKFDSKEIAEVTSTDTIDFEEIGSQKTAVYVISSDTHTAYDFLLTIFFSQMIQQLYNFADDNGGALKVPTYFILDEFANIGKIPDFDKKISTSRSRKISFSVILQNLDQLEAIYDKSYETIIGNCDTHLFLGSNSYKTVEYFSKALGEKTIERDSISINRDRQYFKTGQSTSDQVMARALMTPDELRRMDNDLCIIFEKGIKPVKANKFYYFKHRNMVNALEKVEISHNDIEQIDRGVWRKFNPYNPWTEDKTEKEVENLKVESLDDLFDDEPNKEDKEKKVITTNVNNSRAKEKVDSIDSLDDMFGENNISEQPQNLVVEQQKEEDTYDLQKELEAKFDELFGPMDD